ncbi:ATP12 [Auxenochlorella protothecoides x Auxenochlorella symbiontica]
MTGVLRRSAGRLVSAVEACVAPVQTLSLPGDARRGSATHSVSSSSPRETSIGRFYKHVGVRPEDQGQGYHVTLDSRVLRTPAQKPLMVPSEALAHAIAAEWECQVSGLLRAPTSSHTRTRLQRSRRLVPHDTSPLPLAPLPLPLQQVQRVQPHTMPLMTLAATAIDAPRGRAVVVDTLIHYLHTDSLLCREAPGRLAVLQAETYEPILGWARARLGAALRPSDSIFGAALPDADLAAAQAYLESLDRWHLTALEHLAACCRSVLLACAVVEGEVGVPDALAVARLEESAQIAQWGLVEGGHDIDIADLRVRVAAPSVFLRLLRV